MKTKSEATLSHLMMPDPERDHIFGNPEGDVMFLEYGDYECAYCAEAHDAVIQLAECWAIDCVMRTDIFL